MGDTGREARNHWIQAGTERNAGNGAPVAFVKAIMVGDVIDKSSGALPAQLQATTDRLVRRTRRLNGRTNELRQSVQRLRASTERLRSRLQSSFPPPPPDPPDPPEDEPPPISD